MTMDKAIVGGRTVDVEWSVSDGRLRARIEDRVYEMDVRPQRGVCWLEWQGRSIEAFVERSGDRLLVTIGEHVIPVELLDAQKALRRMGHAGLEGTAILRAPMPGRIVRVLVEAGQTVEAQQGIVVMEAMKMQNEIKAPGAGKVLRLNVKEGAAVAAGDILAEIGGDSITTTSDHLIR